MKEFSEKDLKQLYKEEKMKEIPDLWKKIEENLAPRAQAAETAQKPWEGVVPLKEKQGSRRWLAGLAVAAVGLLAIPLWLLQQGGKKEFNENASMAAEDGMPPDSNMAAGEESADGAPAWEDGAAEAPAEEAANSQTTADKAWEEEFHLEAELSVAQVQTTLGGFLVTGEIRSTEANWFEIGEQVTVFYEGDAYQAEDFSGTIRVLLDVEEENILILEILP